MSAPDRRNQVDRVSNLRHDVMNPLTVILGYAKMLAGRKDIPPDALMHVTRIQEESRRCIEIFDEDKARFDRASAPAVPGEEQGKDVTGLPSVSVLVVDDDPGIRTLSCEVIKSGLADSGLFSDIRIFSADTAEKAMSEAGRNDLDAVVMDLNIGRAGGGVSLVEDLSMVIPGIADRTVFVSGGVLDEGTQIMLDAMRIAVLKKPFSINELVRQVINALSR